MCVAEWVRMHWCVYCRGFVLTMACSILLSMATTLAPEALQERAEERPSMHTSAPHRITGQASKSEPELELRNETEGSRERKQKTKEQWPRGTCRSEQVALQCEPNGGDDPGRRPGGKSPLSNHDAKHRPTATYLPVGYLPVV